MPNPVVVDFILRGMPDVARGLRTVEAAAQASERARTRSATSAAAQRAKAEEQEAKLKVAAMRKADAEIKRIIDKATKDTEKAAERKRKAEEKASKEEERAAEKVANLKIKAAQKVDREVAALNRKRERENDRMLREASRLEEKTHREHMRRLQQEETERRRGRESFARGAGGAITNAVKTGAGRAVGFGKQTMGLVTQLGGGFGIADSVERAARNSGQLEDLLNSAKNPASKIAANKRRRDASEVEPGIQATAIQFGLERENVQKGLTDITGITGDLETGMTLLPQLAELTRASGSNFDEMSQAAGNVALAFDDITDSGKKAEKVMQVMRVLAGQGKAGNIEIRDQAIQAAKMIAAAGRFEGDNAENIQKMGTLMQFSRGGGGAWNAASAATAMTSFVGTFGKGARLDAFESRGINVFADKNKTKIRAPELIIADSLEKTGGNIPQMNALLGSVMGARAVNKFSDIYTRAEAAEKGSGRQKVLDEFNEMTKGTAMSKEEVSDAARRRTGALDAQMAAARERFDQAVQTRLIPSLLQLVPVIEKMVPVFVDLHAQAIPVFVDLIKTFADFAEKNKGIIADVAAHPVGALIAMELTKSITAAGIGQVIKSLLGGGGGGGGMGAVPLAAAGVVAGGAVVGKAMIDYASGEEKALDLKAKVEAFQRGDKERGISPQAAAAEVQAAKDRLAKTGTLEQAANLATSPFVDASDRDYKKFKADQALVDNKALADLIAALNKNTEATKAQGGGGASTPAKPAAASGGIVQRTQ